MDRPAAGSRIAKTRAPALRRPAALMRGARLRGGLRRRWRWRPRHSRAALSHENPARLALLPVSCPMGTPILLALTAAHAGGIGGARAHGQTETGDQARPCHGRYIFLHAPGFPPGFVSEVLSVSAPDQPGGCLEYRRDLPSIKRSMALRPLAIHILRAYYGGM